MLLHNYGRAWLYWSNNGFCHMNTTEWSNSDLLLDDNWWAGLSYSHSLGDVDTS